jgi:hypothetical protein
MTRADDAVLRAAAHPARAQDDNGQDVGRPRTLRVGTRQRRAVVIVLVAALAGALFVAWRASQATPFAQLPVATEPGGAPPAAVTPWSGSPEPGSPEPGSPDPVSLAPSRAVEIYLPNSNPDLVISTSVEALGGCRSVIDPPRNGPDVGGVFGCTDFAQPGTSSPDLAVLAGHSSKKLDTAFNRLYQQGSALTGQTVYVRTEDSGDRWLAYRIEHTDTPQQDELPYLTSVWGGDGSSTAGRLVLVTCQQNDDGTPATANYVAVAQFAGVA